MKKPIALLLIMLLLANVFVIMTAAQTAVDVCFRDMESTSSDLNTARCDFQLSSVTYTQGERSVEYTIGDDAAGGLLVWNYYVPGQETPINIAGATMVQFDLYVPTDGYFDNIKGDARVQIDDAAHKNAWGSSGGTASAAGTKAALKGLKAGWNHVSIPLDTASACTDMADMRIYMGNSGAKSGDKLYVDDIRFVNNLTNQTVTPLRNQAKDVIALVSQEQYVQAGWLYQTLSDAAKAYVPQDLLPILETETTPNAAALTVPLMSFNIRQSEGGDSGMNHWNNRKEAVYDYLNNSGAHAMCLQEVKRTQAGEINTALASKYGSVYYERDNSANPEGLMTIYDKTLYDLVQKQVFWLSETPDQMSKGWGANYYRICVVTVLRHKQSGKLLNVYNVHLDHQVVAAQTNGMNLVLTRMGKRAGHNVVMGDFNVTASGDAYKAIAAQMKDCQKAAPNADSGVTYHGWGSETQGEPIDFIFVDCDLTTPQSFTIGRDNWGDGYYYSDHYAIRSTVVLEYSAESGALAVQQVINQIDGLNVQSINDKPAVQAARAAYNGLTDAQKAMVTNLAELTAAEERITEWELSASYVTMAKEVDDRIAALPETGMDASYRSEIEAIKGAINALPEQAFDLLENLAVFSLNAYAVRLAELLDTYPDDPATLDLTADQWTDLQVQLDEISLKGDAAHVLTQSLADKYQNYMTFIGTVLADVTYGDVDGDGEVSAADALEVLKSVVGKVTLTDEQVKAADVDGNGKADAADALDILKKVVGKIDKFAVEE